MTPIMKRMNKESAVSPVIGVMLMLVVTIIVAAVVAAFAGGLVTTTEKAPTVILDTKIESAHTFDMGGGYKYTYPLLSINYVTGTDKLDTKKMMISSSWNGTDGKLHTHSYSGNQTFTSGSYTLGAMYKSVVSPSVPETPSLWFGNVEVEQGDLLISGGQYVAYGTGSTVVATDDDLSWKKIFGDDCGTIEFGTDVTLTISYGNSVLYDKVVTVE